jgi:hypothetical protein
VKAVCAKIHAMPGYPFGALLALSAQRRLVMQTDLTEGLQAIDLAALYAPLRATFADLNLIDGVPLTPTDAASRLLSASFKLKICGLQSRLRSIRILR